MDNHEGSSGWEAGEGHWREIVPKARGRLPRAEYRGLRYFVEEGCQGDPRRDAPARVALDFLDLEGENLLILEGGCGAWAARYAPRFRRTVQIDSRIQDHRSACVTIAETDPAGTALLLGDLPRRDWAPSAFDAILFRQQKEAARCLAALEQGFHLLRPGGRFIACGGNDEGIKSFEKKGYAVFGNACTLAVKASCRLLCFEKRPGTPAPSDTSGYFEVLRHSLRLPGGDGLEYATKPGVFAYRETDAGTRLLALHLPRLDGLEVLDLACGAGALALAAARLGAARVTAADASVVAVQMAAGNLDRHGVAGEALCAEMADNLGRRFDVVICNPPFHVGKRTDFGFPARVVHALGRHLRPHGEAYVVANRFLDYLGAAGGAFKIVERLDLEARYAVYRLAGPREGR